MKVLNVAEKPSVAKSISAVLSSTSRSLPGVCKYCSNTYFETIFQDVHAEMVFTSVLGHLMELKFAESTRWNECDPYDLFHTPIQRQINPEHKSVVENIQKLARSSNKIIVWTDCDREGENIASQIEEVVGRDVMRARFSGISLQEVQHALNNLVRINYSEAFAVDARMELDLRIGSAFTRLQTLTHNRGSVISFGPCQIPTLNFVVERHRLIEEFFSEPFYILTNIISDRGVQSVFTWKRGSLFDKNCTVHFHNILSRGQARITAKSVTKKEKYRPLPLRTVEFQRVCSSYYKMGSHRLMEIAEKLYSSGYISYPRTETDCFPKNFNFTETVGKLRSDSVLGEYSRTFKFVYPRRGNNNDQAHSPIYPLREGSNLSGDERKVFEFVARRFLGSVSENARGLETEYTMCIEGDGYSEEFVCRGLRVVERNYLDVYLYEKWEAREVGDHKVDEVVENRVEIETGETGSPEYLTESELIGLMDKNGIGTDATIHEHIQKIQTREYAKKENGRMKPLSLGVGLIGAYNAIGLDVCKATLRRKLEDGLREICDGRREKSELVSDEIRVYKEVYRRLEENRGVFKRIVGESCDKSKSGWIENREDGESRENRENQGNRLIGGDRNVKESRKDSRRDMENRKENRENKRNGRNGESTEHREGDREMVRRYSTRMCDCRREARLVETKSGENSGRFFLSCHDFPKKCRFFCWEDSDSDSNGRAEEMEETVKCFCGFETQKKTANTEENKGRVFYCCKKSYRRCKFFKWADE